MIAMSNLPSLFYILDQEARTYDDTEQENIVNFNQNQGKLVTDEGNY